RGVVGGVSGDLGGVDAGAGESSTRCAGDDLVGEGGQSGGLIGGVDGLEDHGAVGDIQRACPGVVGTGDDEGIDLAGAGVTTADGDLMGAVDGPGVQGDAAGDECGAGRNGEVSGAGDGTGG